MILNPVLDKSEENAKTAFGELSVAESTPLVQVQFPYNINTLFIETRINNGAVTQENGMIKLSTGAGANQTAMMLTRGAMRYSPGQGALIRFTTVYTTGVDNSIQLHGVGDAGDGYFFGYDGATFGIMRRIGGRSEIRTLTIATASSNADSVTITLDGDTIAVSVTNTGDKTLTANEIASADYSNVGKGWRTFVDDDTIIFISYDTATHTGTYSLTDATSAAGTFAQTVASVAATETWTAQSSWNHDKLDGAGVSGMTLDPTKGNVYQIRYQWLGFGQIRFYVEHDADGNFDLAHTIDYANNNTIPSILIPNLPVHMMARNAANTSDLLMHSSSMAGFIEGREIKIWPARHALSVEAASVDEASDQPVASIRNNIIYQNRENRTRLWVKFVEVSTSSGNKPIRISFYMSTTLTGSSFSPVNGTTSFVSTDSTATARTGGDLQFTITLNSSDNRFIDLTTDFFFLNPGDVFTISAQQTSAGTNSTVNVSINWVELF